MHNNENQTPFIKLHLGVKCKYWIWKKYEENCYWHLAENMLGYTVNSNLKLLLQGG